MRDPAALISLTTATARDRDQIYGLRHEVYALELGQHSVNPEYELHDALDEENHYLVAKFGDRVIGFVSITPPEAGRYSIEKYFGWDEMPCDRSEGLFEIRLLTVVTEWRHHDLFLLLGYAAYRWVEAHGGSHVLGMGRLPLMSLYRRLGLEPHSLTTTSGALSYQLMHAPIERIAKRAAHYRKYLERGGQKFDWKFSFAFQPPASCFHGGASFAAIGTRLETLERKDEIINADVLDAWFPPAPGVMAALTADLPWLLRTSPPTHCEGLISAISEARGVKPVNVLPGAGSSDLIFRAFRHWLNWNSRVLILEPTYGEYRHVLERVIGCQVSRIQLDLEADFEVDLDLLREEVATEYDLIVLVNPNSPTGRHIQVEELQEILASSSPETRIWVDETYIDYVSPKQSLEQFAASSENVIVCKSMSKVYALSGVRVAYLCAGAHQLEALRVITPPWAVGLPSQLAAIQALDNPDYYTARYQETHRLREELAEGMMKLGWMPISGVANFILCRLPEKGPPAAVILDQCRAAKVFLRDPSNMGTDSGENLLRVAVKDATTNARILEMLHSIAGASGGSLL